MTRKVIARIRMWYHANSVLVIRKLANRQNWVAGKDDAIKRIITRHCKKCLMLAEQLGYALSDKGMAFVKES